MILKFPNLDTVRLALTTGAIPSGVARTSAVAGFDDEQHLWVETEASLSRAVQNELKRLGVQTAKSSGATLTIDVCCWAELLPLQADARPVAGLEKTPILFDLAGGEHLSQLVVEILRLGNDRQGFRWLESDESKNTRALLRVIGPPYYSLLRALDRNGNTTGPRAFVERAPRVWVEVGQTHPLVEQIKPPEGKILLMRPPRVWTLLDDGPFRDIYEVLEFPLADAPARWREVPLGHKIKVTPTLKPGGSPDGAELWVLRDNPVEELNRFVQNADGQILHRLAFAVGEKDGEQTIVLRVRPSKLPPPVVVLKSVGYRPYKTLPNLFLPVGARLHPPMTGLSRPRACRRTSSGRWGTGSTSSSITIGRSYKRGYRRHSSTSNRSSATRTARPGQSSHRRNPTSRSAKSVRTKAAEASPKQSYGSRRTTTSRTKKTPCPSKRSTKPCPPPSRASCDNN